MLLLLCPTTARLLPYCCPTAALLLPYCCPCVTLSGSAHGDTWRPHGQVHTALTGAHGVCVCGGGGGRGLGDWRPRWWPETIMATRGGGGLNDLAAEQKEQQPTRVCRRCMVLVRLDVTRNIAGASKCCTHTRQATVRVVFADSHCLRPPAPRVCRCRCRACAWRSCRAAPCSWPAYSASHTSG